MAQLPGVQSAAILCTQMDVQKKYHKTRKHQDVSTCLIIEWCHLRSGEAGNAAVCMPIEATCQLSLQPDEATAPLNRERRNHAMPRLIRQRAPAQMEVEQGTPRLVTPSLECGRSSS